MTRASGYFDIRKTDGTFVPTSCKNRVSGRRIVVFFLIADVQKFHQPFGDGFDIDPV